MTEISFYFNVPGRVDYACRLARKAHRQGVGIAVVGAAETLAEFDRALWAVAASDFVPHSWSERQAEVPARLHASTVWLGAVALAAPLHDALINIGEPVPAGFESFSRLYEIVSSEEADRLAARKRWKAYTDRGYAIQRHEVGSA